MAARGETNNDMRTNGELRLQRAVLGALPVGVTPNILDIGANEGLWTIAALDDARASRREVRIWSFEPVPATYARFKARLSAHPLSSSVQHVPRALSDAPGTATMNVGAGGGGTSTLGVAEGGDGAPSTVAVEVDTLDAFCAAEGIERLHLVKCDTEGFDLKVIQGARRLLAEECIDVMQFEYNHRWVYNRSFLRDVFQLVEGSPYRIGLVTPQHVQLYGRWHPEMERYFEANYALIHERVCASAGVVEGGIGTANVWLRS